MVNPRVNVQHNAAKNEIITIKTLIRNKMESCRGLIGKPGEKIPRKIIKKFVAKFNGEQVFAVDIEPSLSANPFLQFNVRIPESGEFEFSWFDIDGAAHTTRKKITVS